MVTYIVSHCDLVSEVLFQPLKCVMFVHVHFGFQMCLPPKKKPAQETWLTSQMTHLGNMAVTQSIDSHAVYAEAPSN